MFPTFVLVSAPRNTSAHTEEKKGLSKSIQTRIVTSDAEGKKLGYL